MISSAGRDYELLCHLQNWLSDWSVECLVISQLFNHRTASSAHDGSQLVHTRSWKYSFFCFSSLSVFSASSEIFSFSHQVSSLAYSSCSRMTNPTVLGKRQLKTRFIDWRRKLFLVLPDVSLWSKLVQDSDLSVSNSTVLQYTVALADRFTTVEEFLTVDEKELISLGITDPVNRACLLKQARLLDEKVSQSGRIRYSLTDGLDSD